MKLSLRLARQSRFFLFGAFLLLFFFNYISSASALGFGSNKVRYHTDHHWKILETNHFEIYYYQECEPMAKKATEYAEKAFLKISKLFDYVPKTKIPLFLYGTPLEFQETNITSELLSEGVGGFTEVFKNRIVVPMGGSYHELEKVITHELTHAFQYDLIYGEGWRSVNLFKAVFVPNWMMEGMAEWVSQHLDSQGEMVLRDAILNDQTIPLNLLESFGHFEQVYTAYKESQSVLEYVSQVYGPEKVVQMMKKMASNQQPDTVVKNTLGISLKELYDHWLFFMKTQAWSRINGLSPPEKYGNKTVEDVAKAAVSPDGNQVVFLKNGELGLVDVRTKKKSTLLKRFFQTQGSGIAWSPDGKNLAYAASRNGEYGLYVFEIQTKKEKEILIPKMPVLYSPAWSPDQKYLIFSGFDYSTVDLYRCEVLTGHLERLTTGLDTKSWGSYSADGKSILYLSETSGETEILMFKLDPMGMPLGDPTTIRTDLGHIASFQVTKDSVFLTADRNNRIFNLYKMDLKGDNLVQATNTYADVLSVAPAPDSPTFYLILYQHSKESLYTCENEKLEKIDHPSVQLKYISNSFENASKDLAANTIKEPSAEIESSTQVDKDDVEGEKKKKIPTRSPEPVTHLEVTEASNLVSLQWPTIDLDSDVIENYKIYRATSAGGSFLPIGTVFNSKVGKYVDYGVQSGNAYFYYVTAVNKIGESEVSPIVEAHPEVRLVSEDYHLKISPDIFLFLARYDSSFGLVGGGIVQLSDYLGDHRLGILGDTIPSVRTGVEANYEFSHLRTTIDLNIFYYQNFFRIFDLQTGGIVNEYRSNENGLDLNFSYPLNSSTRFEYGIGTQRFQGSPLYLRFSEGISNYFQNSDQWNIANYYRLSFVKDKRKGTGFWPSSGYAVNLTLLHALPVLDSNVSFANLLFETQAYADIGFLNHLVWANRWMAMTSQGPNPQSFFIGNDAPFQAFFTTIRGYGANTFFGSNLALWNTELRYPIATDLNFVPQPLSFFLIKSIELAGFLDLGAVTNQLQDLSTVPLLASIGTGIRFYTFVYQRALVMFRFDVAWRLDQAGPPTFNFNLAPIF